MDKELDPRGHWEYGYVARFDNGEEYEHVEYASRDDTLQAIAFVSKDEDSYPSEERLTYTLRRRWVVRIEEPWGEIS